MKLSHLITVLILHILTKVWLNPCRITHTIPENFRANRVPTEYVCMHSVKKYVKTIIT